MPWMHSAMRSWFIDKAKATNLLILALLFFLLPIRWLWCVCIAALSHELGHCCAVYLCGGTVHRFNFRGSGAQIQASGLTINREIICLLAGPFTGLLLLLLYRWFPIIAVCGLYQSIYNLLPIYPLDGGKILKLIIMLNGGTDRVYQFFERVVWIVLIIFYIYVRFRFGFSLLFLIVHLFSEKLLAKSSRIGYNRTDLEYNEVNKP